MPPAKDNAAKGKAAKGKAAQAQETRPEMPLANFGAQLFDTYAATYPAPAVGDIRLCRFGDYLHHFGFTLERERQATKGQRQRQQQQQQQQQRGDAASPSPPPAPDDATVAGEGGGGGGGGRRYRKDCISDNTEPAEEAGWGCAAADVRQADEHCAAVGALPGVTDCAAVAAAVSAPFQQVTWRQSVSQCALKKARAVYMWLCTHVAVTLVPEPAPEETHAAGGADAGKQAAGGAGGRKRSTKKQSLAAAAEAEEVPPVDPLVRALELRRALPPVMAALYAKMLASVNVECAVVAGWVRGVAAEEATEWAWNTVRIGGKQHLVDVSLSTYAGPMRLPDPNAAADAAGTAAGSGAAAAKERKAKAGAGGKQQQQQPSPAAAAAQKQRQDEAAAAAAAKAASGDDGGASDPLQYFDLARGPVLRPHHRPVEDFYFFTHPHQFMCTHFPRNERHALLELPPSRVMWDVAPRLTHDFFRSGIRLVSHRRNCSFSVRSTPFYVTVGNDDPASVELCAALYRGTLRELPEDLSGAEALGPQWVWHQRRESDCTETFTLTVLETGFYTVVLGARRVRADPYSSALPAGAFTPVLLYQAKVHFVPVASAQLPRQHLSPAVCRLITPLSASLLSGVQSFVVMPSCSNVAAVAVVARSAAAAPRLSDDPAATGTAPAAAGGGAAAANKSAAATATSPAAGAAAAAGAGAAATSADDAASEAERRRVVGFLHFVPERVCYEGDVDLPAGETAEVWVLYAAPDRDGLCFTDKAPPAAETAAPAPPAAAGKKHKGDAAAAGGAGGGAAEAPDAEAAAVAQRLAYGRVFVPCVTGVEVRKLTPKDTGDLIRPRPTAREERVATLRRLAGVTPELYAEAREISQNTNRGVGLYFEARNPGAKVSPAAHQQRRVHAS